MLKPKIPPKRFWDDDKWAHKNYQTLLRKYANSWVAILGHKVIYANPDLAIVKKYLSQKIKDKVVPLLHVEDAAHVY